MPRNRAHLDRDGKRAEILDAAAALFAEHGYAGTSMSAIAARADITKNTIYWYFGDKDALLVGVISRAVRKARTRWLAAPADDLAAKLEHLTSVFDEISSLTAALHARLDASPEARAWHERFHAASDAWLGSEISAYVVDRGGVAPAPEAATATVRVWTYAIEGMVANQLPAPERSKLCRHLVAQLDAPAPDR